MLDRRRRANVGQEAADARRSSCDTDGPAMQDQTEAECATLGRRDEGIEFVLDLYRILEFRETEPLAESEDMGVDRKARKPEGDTSHDVARLAPDSGHRDEVVQLSGNLSTKAIYECRRHPDEAARLGPEESGRMDDLFELLGIGPGQRGGIRVGREQGGRDHVHPDIGALG